MHGTNLDHACYFIDAEELYGKPSFIRYFRKCRESMIKKFSAKDRVLKTGVRVKTINGTYSDFSYNCKKLLELNDWLNLSLFNLDFQAAGRISEVLLNHLLKLTVSVIGRIYYMFGFEYII